MNPNVIIGETTGLNSHPNELSSPIGSTSVADNVSFNRDRMPERRNGFKDFSSNLPDFAPKQLLVGSNGTDRYLNLDGGLWYYDTTTTRWLRKRGAINSGGEQAADVVVVSGFAYVTGLTAHVVYKINIATGARTVFAGRCGVLGSADGTGDTARFKNPVGITSDGTNLFVCDQGNFTIRKIGISSGAVTTLAGQVGVTGSTDNTGTLASFKLPSYIANDGTNLYVSDTTNETIRRIVISSAAVTTIAGQVGVSGSANGTGAGATFSSGVNGLYFFGTNLYVCDTATHIIRKIAPPLTAGAGVVTTIAGLAGAPAGTDGTGTAARFNAPRAITGDGTNLYVAENCTVRKIVISSVAVTTTLGSAVGQVDDVGTAARLQGPTGITYDGTDLYVADLTTLRKAYISSWYLTTLTTPVTTLSTGRQGSHVDGIIYGPDVGASERRIRSFEMSGCSFFATHRGIAKSTSTSADVTAAGLPRFLDPSIAEVAGTILATTGLSRAYRLTWALRDAANNLIVGDRSARVVWTATGATKNVRMAWPIPPEITISHVFQVFATAIAASGIDPGDSMVQIFERNPTSAEIAAETITWDDIIPDAFRNVGTPLYTNSDQEGGAAGNAQPPLARDVCEFRGHGFFANYTDKQTMNLQLVDAASLVANTSTVTLGSVVYTAKAAETITAGEFQKWTTGTAAQNVENTAKSLCRVINSYAANSTIYAFYASTPTTIPGKIIIQERAIGGSAYVAICDGATTAGCFVPPLPTSGSTYTSVADRRKNRIRVSKFQQPEHVPLVRELVCGAENDEIQRIIPLRDSIVVVKDRSIGRITGSTFADFVYAPLDDTTSCGGRDSYAKLNNCVFGLSNQGFVAITDNGVQIVGRPEEHRVLAGLAVKNAPDHDTFVGVGDEVKRLYICRAYDAAASLNVTYAYNAITRQWSRWLIDPACMAVASDRIVYGLNNALGHVLLERDSRRDGESAYRDFADESATFTIASIDTTAKTATGTFTAGVDYTGAAYASSIGYGWKIYDGANQYLVLSSSGSGTIILTLNSVTSLTTGAKTVYRPIPVEVEFNPLTAGNPGELTQWGEIIVRAETQNAYKASLSFANEIDYKTDPVATTWPGQPATQDSYVCVSGEPSATNNDFAATPGNVYPGSTIKAAVPKERAVGEQLSIRVAQSVAESRFSIKAVIAQARAVGSNKGHR